MINRVRTCLLVSLFFIISPVCDLNKLETFYLWWYMFTEQNVKEKK